jgi:hypothetical protein
MLSLYSDWLQDGQPGFDSWKGQFWFCSRHQVKTSEGAYSVLNVQGRVQTVGDIGEISNNNCKKHKA